MEMSTRIKALKSLVSSGSPEAMAAVRREFLRAIDEVESNSSNENADALRTLQVTGFIDSKKTAATLIQLLRRAISSSNQNHLPETYAVTADASLAIDVIRSIRWYEPVQIGLFLIEVSQIQNDFLARKARAALEDLCTYDLDVFYGPQGAGGLGATPQLSLISAIHALDDEYLRSNSDQVLTICSALLSPVASGSTWTSSSVQIRNASVPAAGTIPEVRDLAILTTRRIIGMSSESRTLLRAVSTLNQAARIETRSVQSDSVASMIQENTRSILEIYKAMASDVSLEVLQKIEHNAYWIYKRTRVKQMQDAALEVKKEIDRVAEYSIFKILVGFEGVFGDWDTEDEGAKWRLSGERRNAAATELAVSIDDNNFLEWKDRIIKYSDVRSSDLATFPVFIAFLRKFASNKPRLALLLLDEQELRFSVPVLIGVLDSDERNSGLFLIKRWTEAGLHLVDSLRALENSSGFEEERFLALFEAAISANNIPAISACISLATAKVEISPKKATDLFSRAVFELTLRKDVSWVFDFWYRDEAKIIIGLLDEDQCKQVLANLLWLPKIDFHSEEVLCVIAGRNPHLVMSFLSDRLWQSYNLKDNPDYEAAPWGLHQLDAILSDPPSVAMNELRGVYSKGPDDLRYGAMKLVRAIFHALNQAFIDELLVLVNQLPENQLNFVVDVLKEFNGDSRLLPVFRQLVRRVSPESAHIPEIEFAMELTGVVSGEYGFVNAYRQKIVDMETWNDDPDPKVRVFSARFAADLTRRMDIEEKRATEDLKLRKFRYGEPLE